MGQQESIRTETAAVYSYHTFLFPFLWDDGGKVSRQEFEACMDSRWKLQLLETSQDIVKGAATQDLRYNQFQYFNAAARTVLYTMADDQWQSVRNFRFSSEALGGNDSKVRYQICKNMEIGGEKKDLTYSLRVNGIRLKLYDTGVGILVYELENIDPKAAALEDVNRINEFGRRVFMPFEWVEEERSEDVVRKKTGCSLCADVLTLEGLEDGKGKQVTSMLTGNIPAETPDAELARIVTFLFENGNHRITTKRVHPKEEFYIEPIIDDRMFVACYVIDSTFSKAFAEWNGAEYRYLSDALEKEPKAKDNLARRLYELFFIDGDGISCHSRNMLHDLLQRHVYDRWIEYRDGGKISNTLTGITEYSLVTLSASAFPLNAFLTIYIEMAMLSLAQRASLLSFENRISRAAIDLQGEKKLQESFVRFSSSYLLQEVTPQQQGIEMYNRMQEMLYVHNGTEKLENQIRSLFELRNYKTDRGENMILAIIAVLGVISALDVLFQWIGFELLWGQLLGFLVITAILLVAFFKYYRE